MSAPSARALGLVLLLSCIVLSAAGQLGMKVGMQELHRLPGTVQVALESEGLSALLPALAWTLGGLAAYGLSLLAWLAVLVRYPLSYAYPLLGLSYVLVYLGATHWERLMEPATALRSFGTLLILAGVALVSLSGMRGPVGAGYESTGAAD
jgi:undecaprenyl phosphate-alpha-L-ara4N flippase subunit ArnF